MKKVSACRVFPAATSAERQRKLLWGSEIPHQAPSDTPGDVFVVEAPFARRVDIRRVKAKAYMFVSTLVFVPATAVWGRGMGIGVGGEIGSNVTTVSS